MGRRKYTIVLPVHNGGEYVKACVASILKQNLPDFDVAILENASTDGTAQWLKTLDDSRIRVVPSGSFLGIEQNWARILEVPKNPYMVLIGHDDILYPQYLSTIDRLIDANPDAALYLTHFHLIDEQGRVIRNCWPIPEREAGFEYLRGRLLRERDCQGPGWVLRSEDYERLGGIPMFKHLLFADDALAILLMETSWKAASPDFCFAARLHAHSVGSAVDLVTLMTAAADYARFMAPLNQRNEHVATTLKRHGPAFFVHMMQRAHEIEYLRRESVGEEVPASLFEMAETVSAIFAPQYRLPKRPPYSTLLHFVPRGRMRRYAARAILTLRSWAVVWYRRLSYLSRKIGAP